MVKIRENIVKNKMMLLQISVNQIYTSYENHMKIICFSHVFHMIKNNVKSRENDVKNHVKSREKTRKNIVKSREKHSENNVNFTKSLFQLIDFKRIASCVNHMKIICSSYVNHMKIICSTRARVFDTVIYIVLNIELNTVLYYSKIIYKKN